MALKTKLANWLLKKKIEKVSRQVRVYNFDSARTVGIVWSFEERNAFYTLQKALKNPSIQLKSLHYGNNSETVQGGSFNKSDLTWLGFPKEIVINEFVHQKFDILIDLSIEKKFPLQVVISLSQASFKVGFSNQTENFYDLNIDISKKPDADYLVEQILNYLSLINK